MNLTEMVKQREIEFDENNENVQEDVEIVNSKDDFKFFMIDGSGKEMCIKEVPYFSEEAKNL